MNTLRQQIEPALKSLETWLGKPRRLYEADVFLFARGLSPDEILEGVEIARERFPEGGLRGFKYFCGVCHRKIDRHRLEAAWNDSDN